MSSSAQPPSAGASVRGKAVIVSGAASGMGAACVELLRAGGAEVLAVDRDADGLRGLSEAHSVATLRCDLAAIESVGEVVGTALEQFERIDGLVNAAGIFQTRKVLEVTPEDFDRIFAINVRGLFFLMQAVGAEMSRAGKGSIVNFASTAARVPRPLSSHYAATKAAVVSLTRSAAASFASDGVRVNAVCPGVIKTPMIDAVVRERSELYGLTLEQMEDDLNRTNPMGRMGTPGEVAEVVLFLLSDAAGYVTGEALGITGGTDFD
jgi:NAD(P)-dependent dehydrogenase (short-subunit alcohol dehydrogenase family)